MNRIRTRSHSTPLRPEWATNGVTVATRHYRRRCAERGIPTDAVEVLVRYGEPRPGREPDETVYYLSRLAAHQYAERGHDIWAYAEVAVVVRRGESAVTAFRMTEDEARRRWSARVCRRGGGDR